MLCLVAVALLCWPTRPSLRRVGGPARPGSPSPLRADARGGSPPGVRLRLTRLRGGGNGFPGRAVAGAGVLVIAAIALAAGPAASIATLLTAATVAALASAELRRRRDRRQVGLLLVATRTLAREVRTGSSPMAAVLATAAAHPGCAAALDQLAMAVLDGRGGSPTAQDPGRRDRQVAVVDRLGEAWQLSARHGIPWAALIDTVADDLDDQQRAEASRTAQVAGPRVSGYVLAVMPALGILLGAGMGADPVHVLLHTGVGSVLLMVGTALTCLGLAWTSSIVRA